MCIIASNIYLLKINYLENVFLNMVKMNIISHYDDL